MGDSGNSPVRLTCAILLHALGFRLMEPVVQMNVVVMGDLRDRVKRAARVLGYENTSHFVAEVLDEKLNEPVTAAKLAHAEDLARLRDEEYEELLRKSREAFDRDQKKE